MRKMKNEKCIQYEMIPYIRKTAIIISLNIKGLIHSKRNYWPVFLTCVLWKLIENWLEITYQIYRVDINWNQHGFIYGKSALFNIF